MLRSNVSTAKRKHDKMQSQNGIRIPTYMACGAVWPQAENNLWPGCCTPSEIPSRVYLTSKQTDQTHAPSSLNPNTDYSQLLQIFVQIFPLAIVQWNELPHHIPSDTLTLHGMHALNHSIYCYLFLISSVTYLLTF